jgi:hypothetical protein
METDVFGLVAMTIAVTVIMIAFWVGLWLIWFYWGLKKEDNKIDRSKWN